MATACVSCKVQKRKCDKATPKCSQCSIRSCECVYPGRTGKVSRKISSSRIDRDAVADNNNGLPPTPGLLHTDHPCELQNANELWAPRVEFPSVYFVDRDVFRQHRIHVPTACPGTSAFPTVFIGATLAEQDSYVSAFFNGVHRWLPVLDEERFRGRLLGKTPAELPADVALLLLCMRLITSAPSESSRNGTRTDLHLAAKQGFLNLEMAGVLSVECLEAGLLISLYEINHAIYPSAFLSVGACTRYGQAMGFGGLNALRLRPPYNRSELEESRRLWWAVVLLDRYLNLGSPSRLASVHDPPDDGSMVVYDDETATANSFGSGKLGRRDQGCPALIAQATRLLGKVLWHTSHNYGSEMGLEMGSEAQYLELGLSLRQRQEKESSQLGRTIASLIDAAETEARKWEVPIEEQLMICYSSLFVLYNHNESCKGDHTQWDEQTLAAVDATRATVIRRCRNLLSDQTSSLESISPFFVHCIYMVAILGQSETQTAAETRGVLVKALRRLERRWQAAGVYIEILEAREILQSP
ncbi:fungal zn(2)-Cys(6) binuclear cluster domain-containing protein [Trichoderma breve]|uniref:Fungal zn(2)-Cys(6) binuclear cluster domain-containing protein n=1 Tax=Trichoderma breve TaxID=2034170 RepID=A0A9W9E4C9_9HYPO|nr:fungal zn(2)-Cys(6) binuclear cluster domain-containing protein [Trichoderma breve]KAJ4854256.1 fungal zn(2)-Cys(6) binuclear cluster domain-containing protein [Trichoderma breve]